MIRIDNIPRWRGLNHFSSLLKNSEFADSSKYEDMGKVSTCESVDTFPG